MGAKLDRRTVMGAALLLAGCGGAPGGPREPGAPGSPLRLAVGEILPGDGPPPLPVANFIDERRSRELTERLRARLASRLVPAGGPAVLRVELDQVALTERLIEGRVGGVGGLVSREPTFAQEGALAVRLRVIEPSGREVAQVRVAVQRSRALPAGASVVTRDEAARALANDLLAQLDDALEVAVRDQLGPWLAG